MSYTLYMFLNKFICLSLLFRQPSSYMAYGGGGKVVGKTISPHSSCTVGAALELSIISHDTPQQVELQELHLFKCRFQMQIQSNAPEQLLNGPYSKIALMTTVNLCQHVFAMTDCCGIMLALLNCGGVF